MSHHSQTGTDMSENDKEPVLSKAEAASNGDARVARSVYSGETSGRTGVSGGKKNDRHAVPRARRMSLSLTHLDAWSVAKVTFLLSVAGGIIQIVAAALVWLLLDVAGVFNQVTQIFSSTGLRTGGFNLANVLSLSTVLSATTIVSIVEVLVLTLLSVIIAALYNVVSQLVGGVHVTLGDD
jgi:hypothetical protein